MCGRSKRSQRQWIDSDIVQTRQGKLQGLQLVDPEIPKTVNVFKGIPFAKPPVGPLRFKKPQPLDNWEGIRAAKKWGPIAIQKLLFKSKELCKMSEDCLYLNVFAPTWKPAEETSSGFPVLVFIHSGGFAAGEAITYGDVGICKGLITKDIIVVTIQYRLGYLGFWHSGDGTIPSNLGLWDQTAALQWVHDNTGSFGGDAGNVTIVGQSAGGASVDLLSLSPISYDLFHKVVPMAGTACAEWADNTSTMKATCETQARKMGIEWKTPEELLSKLMKAKAEDFAFSMLCRKGFEQGLECSPVFDGFFFFPEPIAVLRRKAPNKPMMTGVTKFEGILEDLMRHYIPGEGKRPAKQVYKGQCELMADVFFNAPTLRMVRETMERSKGGESTPFHVIGMAPIMSITAGDTPVFLYTWDYYNPRSWGWSRFFMKFVDSSHGTELAYLFGKSCIFPFKFNEHDCAMFEVFTTAFANFTKYGNPNGATEDKSDLPIEWPQISNSSPEQRMAFNLTSTTINQFFNGIPAAILEYQK